MKSTDYRTAAEYELIVASFFADKLKSFSSTDGSYVHPEVFHRKKYKGLSGHKHEIDLSFELDVAEVKVLIFVECKCYSRKVGVDELLEFVGRLRDTGAHKGILVTTNGFQRGAIEVAKANNVALVVANRTSWRTPLPMHNIAIDFLIGLVHIIMFVFRAIKSAFSGETRDYLPVSEVEKRDSIVNYLNQAIGLSITKRNEYSNCYPISTDHLGELTHLSMLPTYKVEELQLLSKNQSFKLIDWIKEPPLAYEFITETVSGGEALYFGPSSVSEKSISP